MDKTIIDILNTIETAGFEAYIVGGYVRDRILGINSTDVDICSNARPMDLKAIFPKANFTDSLYGSVKIITSKYHFDITTYREERDYENRHPKEIRYVNNLLTDLKRRDFTMNAVCLDKEGKLIDLLGGIKDIQNKTIKVIGPLKKKFNEDPLRILRAVRFAATLNFKMDKKTLHFISKNAHLVENLSRERQKMELERLFMSKQAAAGLKLMDALGLLKCLKIRYTNFIPVKDICAMWAEIECIEPFPFTKEEQKNIGKIKEIIKYGKIDNTILYNYDLYLCIAAGEVLGEKTSKIYKKYQELPIKKESEMAMSIIEMSQYFHVKPSAKIKELHKKIALLIVSGQIKNESVAIYEYLERKRHEYEL